MLRFVAMNSGTEVLSGCSAAVAFVSAMLVAQVIMIVERELRNVDRLKWVRLLFMYVNGCVCFGFVDWLVVRHQFVAKYGRGRHSHHHHNHPD